MKLVLVHVCCTEEHNTTASFSDAIHMNQYDRKHDYSALLYKLQMGYYEK